MKGQLLTILLSLTIALPAFAAEKMILVKEGSFTPLFAGTKNAKIEKFYLDETAVTNEEFLKFLTTHPKWQRDQIKSLFAEQKYLKHWQGNMQVGKDVTPDSPVVYISWFAANEFCLSQGKRLPTSLEWEYAAQLPLADPRREIKAVILEWYENLSTPKLPKVGSALENAVGIKDLHGLIWEWTLDFNDTMVTGESRGDSALEKGLYCGSGVIGSADPSDYAAFMRFGFRSSLKANYTLGNLGFRCAKNF